MKPWLATLVLVLLAPGCAVVRWSHPTKTDVQQLPDRDACDEESAALFPPVVATREVTWILDTNPPTDCRRTESGGLECAWQRDRFEPWLVYTEEINATKRRLAYCACMEARGWRRMVP